MINDLITAFVVAFAASIASAPSPKFGNIFDGVEGRPLPVIHKVADRLQSRVLGNSFASVVCRRSRNDSPADRVCRTFLKCLWSVCYRTDGEVCGQMPPLTIAAPPATNPFVERCR